MKKQEAMNPQEKWNRLSNPQCLKDYGLSITEKEMMSFPKGRAIIGALKKETLLKSTLKRFFNEHTNQP